MRFRLLIIAAIAAALISACKAGPDAEIPEGFPHYECLKAAGQIVIDGRLDEPAWAKAKADSSFRDIRTGDGNQWPEPTKKTYLKMLHDNDYLYIGVRLCEDNIEGTLMQRDTIIWKQNDFEVFIDPKGEGHDYFELEFGPKGTVMDLMMTKPYREKGTFKMGWDCEGLLSAVSYEGTLNDPSDTDTAWCLELAIPFAAVLPQGESVAKGDVWRMTFSRVEWLRKEGPEENWVWSPTGVVDLHIPSLWGFVTFK